jgi:hypothetical protein
MALVASPVCAATVAQTVVLTGKPSAPKAAPAGVSPRIPGFHLVV